LKYFILGSLASAFLLYGIALIYGATATAGGLPGTTNIAEIARRLNESQYPPLLFAGAAMMLVGFGFKIATAPFHIWTPDVYEGAPTPVTAFMAAGPKAAGFASFLRVFVFAFPFVVRPESRLWPGKFITHGWRTCRAGNHDDDGRQRRCHRAEQRQAHACLFVDSPCRLRACWLHRGRAAPDLDRRNAAIASVIFYLLTYALMNLGAFAVVQLIARSGDRRTEVDDYNGIGFPVALLAFSLTLFLLSLLGMPLTAGFIGKIMVFRAALDQGYYVLIVIAVLNTAISAYYYLRLIIVMFFRERTTVWSSHPFPASIGVALVITLAGVLYLGLFPGRVINALQTKPIVTLSRR
jgi:NADH-quinone oxidoreductase subunit N